MENSEKIIEENIKKNIERKKDGIFLINSNFDDNLLEFLYYDLKEAGENKNIEKIKIQINSDGGDTTTLFPLIDLINSFDKPVETTVLGKAYSCGAMLLLSGTEGHRFAYKHSSILLHEVSADYGYNKNSQNKEYNIWLDTINNQLIKLIKEKTKMTNEQIEKFFSSNKDIFIDSNQSLKYGIIDKII